MQSCYYADLEINSSDLLNFKSFTNQSLKILETGRRLLFQFKAKIQVFSLF